MNKVKTIEFLMNNQEFWPTGLTAKKVSSMQEDDLKKMSLTIIKAINHDYFVRNIIRMEAPTYKVLGETLNEYELRRLMLDVKWGRFQSGIQVTDQKGKSCIITETGMLSEELYGLDILGNLTLSLLRENS